MFINEHTLRKVLLSDSFENGEYQIIIYKNRIRIAILKNVYDSLHKMQYKLILSLSIN